MIAGWKREGLTLEHLRAAPDQVTFLNELYVRISAAAKADPVVEEEAPPQPVAETETPDAEVAAVAGEASADEAPAEEESEKKSA